VSVKRFLLHIFHYVVWFATVLSIECIVLGMQHVCRAYIFVGVALSISQFVWRMMYKRLRTQSVRLPLYAATNVLPRLHNTHQFKQWDGIRIA
jgi:hypothetical protein